MAEERDSLKLVDVKTDDKAVLGVLEGPCADFINPTRNERYYNEELWDKTFNDPIVEEMLEQGGIPGELDHPADREETDSTKIAILMKEKPVKKKDGKLWAKFQILNTPCGKIAYTLAKAGFKFGISSRGTGDTYSDEDGSEIVDADTYDFKCFDLVLLPAVKDARLSLVEGLNTKYDYKKVLKEELENSSDEDKRIMEDALSNLNIQLDESVKSEELCPKCENKLSECTCQEEVKEVKEECNSENCSDKEIETKEEEAKDNGTEELVKNLQEALLNNSKLEETILKLQNELAIRDSKVNTLNEELENYKQVSTRLSSINAEKKELDNELKSLNEELDRKDETIKNQDAQITDLKENRKLLYVSTKSLKEELEQKENIITEYETRITTIQNELSDKDNTIKSLNEQLENNNQVSKAEITKLNEKLSKITSIAKKYKNSAYSMADRYIESKANMLGVTKNEIKNRLNESYNLEDVDRVCEELKTYRLNINKLPFSLGSQTKIRVKESVNESMMTKTNQEDLDVDEFIRKVAQDY